MYSPACEALCLSDLSSIEMAWQDIKKIPKYETMQRSILQLLHVYRRKDWLILIGASHGYERA